MIISHKYRFVFLCLPRTGTTALREEFCQNYGGEKILYKHAPLDKFFQVASSEEKKYKIIASLRNPLDRTVSLYFKYLNNHDGIHNKQIKEVGDKNIFQLFILKIANSILIKRAKRVSSSKMSFEDFIKNYFSAPYSDWHSMYFKKYDFIIKFEAINEDFHKTLSGLGIDPIRDLPIVNKTKKEEKSYVDFYTPEIIPIVQKNFYFAMKLYGYEFPSNWPKYEPSFVDSMRYSVYTKIKQIYWKYIR